MCRMAAKFPQEPSAQEQADVVAFLHTLGHLYPCDECAGHFRGVLRDVPPRAGSNLELSMWLCQVHNIVNARVGHPLFTCSKEALQERWGDCGCFGSESGSQAPGASGDSSGGVGSVTGGGASATGSAAAGGGAAAGAGAPAGSGMVAASG